MFYGRWQFFLESFCNLNCIYRAEDLPFVLVPTNGKGVLQCIASSCACSLIFPLYVRCFMISLWISGRTGGSNRQTWGLGN
jgi:hypothetical protein